MRTILGRLHAETVTVGTTATVLDGDDTTRPTSPRLTVLIANTSGASIFLGGPAVTTTTGYALIAGAEVTFDATNGAIYAVAAAATDVKLLEGF